MSSKSRQFLTAADLSMLDRVLIRAGIHDLDDAFSRNARQKAARQLIASFQAGTVSEAALLSSLDDEPTDAAPIASIGYDIALKIFSERVPERESEPPTQGGYQYGKRIEIDGGWTVYHVFTGVPAQFGGWAMVDMDAATARRALTILNTPQNESAATFAYRKAL